MNVKLERAAGEIVAPGYQTGKPKAEVMLADLDARRQASPEQQYVMMKAHYKDNTDANAFITSGEVSDTIAAVCFCRLNGRWSMAPKFVSAAELKGACDAYFEIMFDAARSGSKLIPDAEHLYMFLGVTKSTIARWKKDSSPLCEVIEDALQRVLVIKKQLAMAGTIPQLVYMNDIQNNHGYRQKDKDEDTKEERVLPNLEELRERAKLLPG